MRQTQGEDGAMLPVELPAEAKVRGRLETPGDDLALLRMGLLLVKVGEYGINVDWLDEHDPKGEYIVTVFKGEFDNEIGDGFTSRDPQAVKTFVEAEARRLHATSPSP
jgi:hypothetical protein